MEVENILLAPLKSELSPLVADLKTRTELVQKKIFKRTGYYCPELKSFLCFGGHGKVDYALWAARFLSEFKQCKNLILVGAAGGLKESLKVGQIVIGDKCIEHDYHEKFDKRKSPEFYADKKLLRIFGKENQIESILSGDEDIIDANRAAELRERFNAGCVAWEGAGGARAARLFEVGYIEIRGITDSANHFAPEHFRKNLPLCMKSIAQCLMSLKS